MALIDKLKAIADAIRGKTNKSEEMTLEQMASEVSGIDTLQGLDFSEIYDEEYANELNEYFKKTIKNTASNIYPRFAGKNINIAGYTGADSTRLYGIYDGEIAGGNMYYTFRATALFKVIIRNATLTRFIGIFYGCTFLEYVDIKSNMLGVKEWTVTFDRCYNLKTCKLLKWATGNISFSFSSQFSPESIHYIIQNAIDVADGATARTLTLHATAKTNWQNSEYYEQDLAVLEQKGITIA